jgi:hypothetical protein
MLKEIKHTATNRYNCLSYVLGIKNKWIWLDSAGYSEDLEGAIEFLQSRGFSPTNGYFKKGAKKIVVYGNKNKRGEWIVQHFAKQIRKGLYKAKRGNCELAIHTLHDSGYEDMGCKPLKFFEEIGL